MLRSTALVLSLLTLAAPLLPPTATALAEDSRMLPTGIDEAAHKAMVKGGELFKTGQYQSAAEQFKRVANRFPNYEPARVALAKAYYHLEKHQEAHRWFRTVDLKRLDPETSYEYGLSFFRQRDHNEALKGFKGVPKGDPLYSFASYFGAISALKLKKYQVADDMVEGAVELPKKYQESRETYAKHIRALKQRAERKTYGGEEGEEPPPAVAGEKKEKGYKHQGFYEIEKAAYVSSENKKEKVVFHDIRREDVSYTTNKFNLLSGGAYPLRDGDGNQPAVGLNIDLSVEHVSESKLKRSIDRTPDVTSRKEEFKKTAQGAVSLWLEVPVGSMFWAGLKGDFFQEYPDFGRELKVSKRTGNLNLGFKQSNSYIATNFSHAQSVDRDAQPVLAETGYELYGKLKPVEALALKASSKLSQYKYEGEVEGPDRRVTSKLEAEITLPHSFLFEIEGEYKQNTDYRIYEVDELKGKVLQSADSKAIASLTFSPFSWLAVIASISEKRRVFDDSELRTEAERERLKEEQYSSVRTTTIKGVLDLLF